MDPHERATSCWYRVAGLVSREQMDLAVEIIEAEIRSAQQEVWREAAKLVLTADPIEIARKLHERAESGRKRRSDPKQDRHKESISYRGLSRSKSENPSQCSSTE